MQRFVSRDPIGLAGGLNLYVYAKGSPASFVDPSGLKIMIDINATMENYLRLLSAKMEITSTD